MLDRVRAILEAPGTTQPKHVSKAIWDVTTQGLALLNVNVGLKLEAVAEKTAQFADAAARFDPPLVQRAFYELNQRAKYFPRLSEFLETCERLARERGDRRKAEHEAKASESYCPFCYTHRLVDDPTRPGRMRPDHRPDCRAPF